MEQLQDHDLILRPTLPYIGLSVGLSFKPPYISHLSLHGIVFAIYNIHTISHLHDWHFIFAIRNICGINENIALEKFRVQRNEYCKNAMWHAYCNMQT